LRELRWLAIGAVGGLPESVTARIRELGARAWRRLDVETFNFFSGGTGSGGDYVVTARFIQTSVAWEGGAGVRDGVRHESVTGTCRRRPMWRAEAA
jgi:hypothetical protein